MKFEGQYLTFDEYQSLGGTLDDNNAFDLLEYEVRKKIDLRTQNRLAVLNGSIPFAVKICEFKLIDMVREWNKSKQRDENIASETVGSWTRSYATGSQIAETLKVHDTEVEDIMLYDLYNVIVNGECILYLGVK